MSSAFSNLLEAEDEEEGVEVEGLASTLRSGSERESSTETRSFPCSSIKMLLSRETESLLPRFEEASHSTSSSDEDKYEADVSDEHGHEAEASDEDEDDDGEE